MFEPDFVPTEEQSGGDSRVKPAMLKSPALQLRERVKKLYARADILSASGRKPSQAEVREFLELLGQRHSPAIDLARALDDFLKDCCAESWVQDLIQTLLGFVHGEGMRELPYELQLGELIDWYARRVQSLFLLKETLRRDETNAIFSLRTLPQQEHADVKGLGVSVGIKLSGAVLQARWLKVFLRLPRDPQRLKDATAEFQYLSAKREWTFWQHAAADIEDTRLCAMLPLVPQKNAQILDDVRVFIPFAAIAAQSIIEDVEIEAGLYDNSGRCAARVVYRETLGFNPRAYAEDEGQRHLLPPQSFQMWTKDYCSLDRIDNLQVKQSGPGAPLRVGFDFTFAQKATEDLRVEAKLLRLSGECVAQKQLAAAPPSEDGSDLLDAQNLEAGIGFGMCGRKQRARFQRAEAIFAPEFFVLDEGEQELLCEVSLLGAHRKILASEVHCARIIAAATGEPAPRGPSMSISSGSSVEEGVRIQSLEMRGQGVTVALQSQRALRQPLLLEAGIQTADTESNGQTLRASRRGMSAYLVQPWGEGETQVAMILPVQSAAASDKNAAAVLDCALWTLDGQMLASATQRLPGPILTGGETAGKTKDARIVDVELELQSESRCRCVAVIDAALAQYAGQVLRVGYTFTREYSRRRRSEKLRAEEQVDQGFLSFKVPQERFPAAYFQQRLEFSLPLSSQLSGQFFDDLVEDKNAGQASERAVIEINVSDAQGKLLASSSHPLGAERQVAEKPAGKSSFISFRSFW